MKNRRQWTFSRATCDKVRRERIAKGLELLARRLWIEQHDRRKEK